MLKKTLEDKLDALVAKADAIRADSTLSEEEKAAQLAEVDREVMAVKGGKVRKVTGQGAI